MQIHKLNLLTSDHLEIYQLMEVRLEWEFDFGLSIS